MSAHKTANFADGQALDPSDMNNISLWIQAQILDTLSAFGQINPFDVSTNSTLLFAIGEGGAPVQGTGLQIQSRAGIIAQQVNAAGGSAPGSAWCRLSTNDLTSSFDPADPSNPRIDLVCIKLDWALDTPITRDFETTAGVKSTQTFQSARSTLISSLLVVKGTPGATPTIPAVPATMVPWAAVRIPAGATSIALEDIYDYRVPLGGAGYVNVPGKEFSVIPSLVAPFDSFLFNGPAVSGSLPGGANIAFPCRSNQRVLAIELTSDGGTVAQIVAGDDTHVWADNTRPVTLDLSSVLLGATGSVAKRGYTPGVSGTLGPPLWGNGYPNPRVPSSSAPSIGILRVNFAAGIALSIANVRFRVAGA